MYLALGCSLWYNKYFRHMYSWLKSSPMSKFNLFYQNICGKMVYTLSFLPYDMTNYAPMTDYLWMDTDIAQDTARYRHNINGIQCVL